MIVCGVVLVRRCLYKCGSRIEAIQAVWYTEMEIDYEVCCFTH